MQTTPRVGMFATVRNRRGVIAAVEPSPVPADWPLCCDREQLRVVTTVSSNTARVPVTLTRFYKKFERLPPDFNCIETLSMKRVCSTGEIVL